MQVMRSSGFAIGLLVFSAISLVLRALPVSNIFALVVVAGAPLVWVSSSIALLLSLVHRRLVATLVAAALLASSVMVQLPLYLKERPAATDGKHVVLRVLSSNLRRGDADTKSLVQLACDGADVIAVSELTPSAVRRLSLAGIDRTFPYSVLLPDSGAAGIGLWSRFPMRIINPRWMKHTTAVAATVRIPGVMVDPVVASIHLINPLAYGGSSFTAWRDGIVALRAGLQGFAEVAGVGSVVVAGDFNSTSDMYQFRELLGHGYRDAAEQVGTGFAPTFPEHRWLPPLIAIDHILVRRAIVSSIRTVAMEGSDHRSMVASIGLPK